MASRTSRLSQDVAVEAAKSRLFGQEGGVATAVADDAVPDDIVTSWRRSQALGADPGRFTLPYEPEFDANSPLLRAAGPVLHRLATLLGGTDTALILSDNQGRIIARRVGESALVRQLDKVSAVEGFVYTEDAVGTNGLGTVVETGRTIQVVGSEHFAERLAHLTCVGAPITHPITRRLAGVIDLTCHVRHTNALLRPLVEQASRDISERLYQQRSTEEQALLRHLLGSAHASSLALVAINRHIMIANARASRLLAGIDHGLLWEQAGRAIRDGAGDIQQVMVPDGTSISVHITPITDVDTPIGALLEVRPGHPAAHARAGGEEPLHLPGVVGRSPAWQACCQQAWHVARRRDPLILAGEPGTGKLALATALHEALRRDAALVVADAAAAGLEGPSSWLTQLQHDTGEHAEGTLVVRGVDLLAPALVRGLRAVVQALPALGWGLIATTTDRDGGHLFEDCLEGVRVEVPPLRERPADLPLLLEELWRRKGSPHRHGRGVGPEALQALQRASWPGNVRQLAELVDAMSARSSTGPLQLAEIPSELLCDATRRPLTRFERAEVDAILAALRETGGNKKEAATRLGISRSRLYRKLQSVGLDHALY